MIKIISMWLVLIVTLAVILNLFIYTVIGLTNLIGLIPYEFLRIQCTLIMEAVLVVGVFLVSFLLKPSK